MQPVSTVTPPLAIRAASVACGCLVLVSPIGVRPALGQCTAYESAKLTAMDSAANDEFGNSVSLDGNTAVVGAPFDDDAGTNSGSAYVFRKLGGVWQQIAKLTADDAEANDNFGYSVGLSGDTAVVGSYRDGEFNRGAAYMFREIAGVWQQEVKLLASDGLNGDHFGFSVSIDGAIAVIGAPSGDGATELNIGSAYVFRRISGVWQQTAEMNAVAFESQDDFGFSVSVSGSKGLVGAPQHTNLFEGTGLGYVFNQLGATPFQAAELTADDAMIEDSFGYSVGLNGDTALVGAWFDSHDGKFQAGSAYVYRLVGVEWQQIAHLTAADAEAGDVFGTSVAISGDTAVIGARMDDVGATQSGSVYVFREVEDAWSQVVKLVASDAGAGDLLGRSVAIDGGAVIAGAPFHDHAGGAHAGAAYLFDLSTLLLPGDINVDLAVDDIDAALMAEVLLGSDTLPEHIERADINCSGNVDGDDIQPFVNIVAG